MAIEVQPLGVKRIKYEEQELTHYLKPRAEIGSSLPFYIMYIF